MYVVAKLVELIVRGHVLVENLHRQRNQRRVGHPGAVMAVADFAFLVGTHFCHRLAVRLLIVFDRNLGRHAADRICLAAVAGLDDQL